MMNDSDIEAEMPMHQSVVEMADKVDVERDEQEERELQTPMREVSGCNGLVRLNPIVVLVGLGLLWSLSAWGLVDPADLQTRLYAGKDWISLHFTWLSIGSMNAWLLALVYVGYYYGSVRLGKPDEKPEFADTSYFMMIFSAGIGSGLYFYGVGEALYHSTGTYYNSRYLANDALTQDEKDQFAITVTIFHWGILGWATYALMACAMALMSYRYGMPLSFRSTLYPLLGRHTFGWIGDLIDGSTISIIVAGIVCDLGLGAAQLVTGMQRIGILQFDCLTDEDPASSDCLSAGGVQTARIVGVWIIAAIAAVSAVSGIHRGIKVLSQSAFLISVLLLVFVLLADNTGFLLNEIVQSIGHQVQWFPSMSFATDAFAQLPLSGDGVGAATDGRSASPYWLGSWPGFYWGWWKSWAPFVGMFLARISRGRTIREVIIYTIAAPMLYVVLWFTILGGAGIRMHRRATELLANNATARTDTAAQCFDATGSEAHISPVCLYEGDTAGVWFDLMNQYGILGVPLMVLSLVAIAIYFVTSADSGTLVIDALASNGNINGHPAQRVVWAATQGAVTTALLLAGGTDMIYAFQATVVIAGLPFTGLLCFSAAGLIKALANDEVYLANELHTHSVEDLASAIEDAPQFAFPLVGGVFDAVEYVLTCGSPNAGRGTAPVKASDVGAFLLSLVAPFLVHGRVQAFVDEEGGKFLFYSLSVLVSFGVAVSAFVASLAMPQEDLYLSTIASASYLTFAALVGRLRGVFRAWHGISGNAAEDFFAALFLYPAALAQMNATGSRRERETKNM